MLQSGLLKLQLTTASRLANLHTMIINPLTVFKNSLKLSLVFSIYSRLFCRACLADAAFYRRISIVIDIKFSREELNLVILNSPPSFVLFSWLVISQKRLIP
jgi:hypothetical protein